MNCEFCGKKIPKTRLKALPDTVFCVECTDKFPVIAVPICEKNNQDVVMRKSVDLHRISGLQWGETRPAS